LTSGGAIVMRWRCWLGVVQCTRALQQGTDLAAEALADALGDAGDLPVARDDTAPRRRLQTADEVEQRRIAASGWA